MEEALLASQGAQQANETGESPSNGSPIVTKTSSAKENWKKAKVKVSSAVRVKQRLLDLHGLARNTALMRTKSEQDRKRYVLCIMGLIVVLGAITAMTKSAMFHMDAVGRWDHGHAYKFAYALSLTLVVFILKVCLVFVKLISREDDDSGDQEEGVADSDDEEPEPMSLSDRLMPWVLLVSFTFFEMLSAHCGITWPRVWGTDFGVRHLQELQNYIFGTAVCCGLAQEAQLRAVELVALISLALTMATVAEGKGGKKGGAEFNIMGPLLLTISELFHAMMLILQEISVRNYWDDPLELLSASAVIGVVLTLAAMMKASQVWVTLPDGSSHPASDMPDAVLMCLNNPVLGLTMILHLISHVSSDVTHIVILKHISALARTLCNLDVSSDVTHIVILKHISALARTLCDAVKLILMWILGKAFWFFGFFPVLAEAWHPGLIGSWLMLPAICIIIYAMLMFKEASFIPLQIKKTKRTGKKRATYAIEENKVHIDEKAKVGNLEDPFFTAMFRHRAKLQRQHHVGLVSPLKRMLSRSVTSRWGNPSSSVDVGSNGGGPGLAHGETVGPQQGMMPPGWQDLPRERERQKGWQAHALT
eukprot:CAMPEP_0115284290 /NCGR_PEP_ID=MMETSP0270-20121206/60817_1 /TAXON_ID=71861 /ORGANISM="Scrippsiella trochoidea, Strain CCMP3099" /LENGTH=591 /DNA_ID=CAMNT_0002701233 /DNA_START=26 /DNA_END=1800 /DNA_ORIENTATION=-